MASFPPGSYLWALRTVRRTLAREGCPLPEIRWRLAGLLLVERASQIPPVRSAGAAAWAAVPRQEKRRLLALSWAWLIVLGWDEGLDRFETSPRGVVEHLTRIFAAFVLGLEAENRQTSLAGARKLWGRVEGSVLASLEGRFAPGEVESFQSAVEETRIAREIESSGTLSWQSLLYRDRPEEESRLLNANLVGGLEFGRTVRAFVGFLDEAERREQKALVTGLLARAGLGQAASVHQGGASRVLGWRRYAALACAKANALVDIGASLRCLGDRRLFVERRRTAAQFCEQFILDDLHDLRKDCRDGILTCVAYLLLAQGELAEQLERCLRGGGQAARLRDLLFRSELAEESHEGIFLWRPFRVPVEAGRPPSEADELLGLARQLLANTSRERAMSVTELLAWKRTLGTRFWRLWSEGSRREAEKVLVLSGAAERLAADFFRFLGQRSEGPRGHCRPRVPGRGYRWLLRGVAAKIWMASRSWRTWLQIAAGPDLTTTVLSSPRG